MVLIMSRLFFALLIAAAAHAQSVYVRHANGTSTTYTYAQLQTAIDASTCGELIELDTGGARQGTAFTVPNHGCSTYNTIRSIKAYQLTPGARVGSADAANLAFLGLTSGCTVVQFAAGAGYWRLQGLEIAAAPTNCDQGGNALVHTGRTLGGGAGLARVDLFPHHITIDQCWIHGIDSWDIRDGIFADGISLAILNSTIENIRTERTAATGSFAIISYGGLGPIRIENNKLSAAEIHVIWGGALGALQGARTQWISFLGNWLYRPYKWLDWSGTNDPSPLSPCPIDDDSHGATYRNTTAVTYWECQGAAPGTWTAITGATYTALVGVRIPTPNKNIFELKDASFVRLEGNLLDQAYSWNRESQHGACFLFNLTGGNSATPGTPDRISHVTIENNICRHAPWGISQGRVSGVVNWENNGVAAHHIHVRNNLFRDMGEDHYTRTTFGTLSNWAQDATYRQMGSGPYGDTTDDHNTYIGRNTVITNAQDNDALRLDLNTTRPPAPPAFPYPQGQRVTNAILTAQRSPIQLGGNGIESAVNRGWGNYAELAQVGFVDSLSIGFNAMVAAWAHCNPGDGDCAYLTAWNTPPSNCLGCQYPTIAAAKFTSYPTDLSLDPTSPFKAAGLDGRDLGADLSTITWATAGAAAGTFPAYLRSQIRRITPAATSVTLRYSAPDLTNCTIEARIYGFPFAAPAATTTDTSGKIDRITTLSGLTAGTKYGLKITCAGMYREDDFRTTP
jgi:hypothetical protein